MNYTTNSSRVPNTSDTNPVGSVDIGPAPAISGQFPDSVSFNETNDGVTVNPPGPVTLNNDGLRSKLVTCRKHVFISTFNARTLYPSSRLTELVLSAQQQNIDIIAVQEHRLYHPDVDIKYHKIENYQLATASCLKNSVNASYGGVGLLLSPRAMESLCKVDKISSQVVIADFEGNPKSTIISCHSPHNNSSDEDINQFYNTLRSTLENVPKHNFLLIPGDFNARLGPDDAKFTFHSETNRNGEYLVDLMEEFSLCPANTKFMRSKHKLWTFEYPSGQRAQLDYILVRKKWQNSIRNCRPYSSFSTVGSDHRIVSADVKLSFRVSKKSAPDPMKAIDWKKVSHDKNLSSLYSVSVFNRFQELSSDSQLASDNIDTFYNNLILANKEVSQSLLPKKPKRSKNTINSEEKVSIARENLKKISLEYHSTPSISNKDKLAVAKKSLDDAYIDAQVAYINGKIDDLSNLHLNQQHSAAWNTINELSGKGSKPSTTIKGGSREKRLENWLSHFKNLLGKPATLPENTSLPKVQVSNLLNISTNEFVKPELTYVLKSMKNKALGPDKIPVILWKDPIFHQLLLDLCNFAFSNHISPSIWLQSQIIPIPKKGDLSLPTNYRGISLLPIAAKIYNKLILNRLRPKIEPILRKNQNGFRPGRSTLGQILTLRRIIEEITHCNKTAALIFVDFSKAFDSVNRDKMFEILELYGIPPEIISAIKVLYSNTKSTILTPDGETEHFDILAGILQGDTLAPFLFIIVIDYVMRVSVDTMKENGLLYQPRKSSRYPALHITDADFADDIALLADNLTNAQALLSALESAANCTGLYLNESKTECMPVNIRTHIEMKTLANNTLKYVDDYKYLGSHIRNSEKDFNTRKGMAWAACNNMDKIWKSKLDRTIKIKIFRVTIEPILLYGSETWTLSAKQHARLDGCYTRLLRRVLNLSWKKHPTLATLYGNLPKISVLAKRRRVQFAGHCARASNELVSSFVLWKHPLSQRRSRKLTFPDTISRDTNISKEDLLTAMTDRVFWKSVVNSISAEAEQ